MSFDEASQWIARNVSLVLTFPLVVVSFCQKVSENSNILVDSGFCLPKHIRGPSPHHHSRGIFEFPHSALLEGPPSQCSWEGSVICGLQLSNVGFHILPCQSYLKDIYVGLVSEKIKQSTFSGTFWFLFHLCAYVPGNIFKQGTIRIHSAFLNPYITFRDQS